ncbi:TonB-dependent receptor [Paraglaciecola polaris]|uniref:TonB-dependent receptor n=1 Tax=Paraglaciecola polaris LMG 21857 TaxID=1129793 RepID=K6YGR6_9ALTE|nr:TonB-dependent receptor [Paraglaciecola polaris]GAC31929.1 TonB-dependent receptor [Paraglaciecola polaris LMG 21857]
MKYFKPSLIKVALISSGFAFGLSPMAFAQETPADAPSDDTEVIQVTGIRGSLMRAQAIKMDNTSIVEAISAEDIGKLPDTSVAESLARLPGLAGERRNGRTSGLSVRGFNENYVGTSLNGRELLGMGDNRGVEFDLYPTEIVSNILVYKTPEAGMLTQGVGGTVDLQTVKPLGQERTFAVNGSFEQNEQDSANPDYDNDGHRFSFNYIDSFANDTIGVALVLASLETPRQEEQFRGWGYADVNTDSPRRASDTAMASPGDVVLGGHDSFVRSALLERDSIAAVIQWAPNDRLMVQLDALYIDFEENEVKRGLEEGGAEWGVGDNYQITGVDNGLVTSGYYDGFLSVIRNDGRSQKSDLTTIGINAEYQINDNWTAELDFSTGEVKKKITDIESYSGVGRAGIDGRSQAARSWEMTSTGVIYSDHPTIAPLDYTDASLITLAGPQAWGGALSPLSTFQDSGTGFGPDTAQDGFVNDADFNEELDTIRLQANGVVEWGIFSGLETGIVYSERSKTKINTGVFLTAPTWPGEGPIPDPVGVADLSFIGISGVVAYDSLALYNSGYYIESDAVRLDNTRLGDTYEVNEDLLTVYAKLDIDTEIGDVYVKGNIGLQMVNADQSATGFSGVSGPDGFTVSQPVDGGTSYTDVLPSLNLSFEIAENQFIRTALSKVISRPRMDDMKPNNQVSFAFNDSNILSTDPLNSPWSGSAGDPELKPLEANQFDLAYENYFADDGFFAVSFFFKDLTNWTRSSAELADFSEFFIPGYHQSSAETGNQDPATFLGVVTGKEDGLKGFVRGYEFQVGLPFHVLTDYLDGFGVVASATFLDGEFDDGQRIPGLSQELYSFTAYYEAKGFEIRVSGTKRDEFLTEVRGLSLSLGPTTDQGGEQWDAQIGYDFADSGIAGLEGLRITLQGQNLTDEATVQANGGDSRQITQYQSFGRNYLLGFNYSF